MIEHQARGGSGGLFAQTLFGRGVKQDDRSSGKQAPTVTMKDGLVDPHIVEESQYCLDQLISPNF